MDKEILEMIVKNLVANPEQVTITKTQNDQITTFSVVVGEEDMGKVIGKQGRMAKAIRTVVKAIATKENQRVNVEFVDHT